MLCTVVTSVLDWVRPLGEGDDDSLQGFADVVVEPVVVAESLIPRPHKVTVRVLQHLHQAHHRQHSVLPSGVSHTHMHTLSRSGARFSKLLTKILGKPPNLTKISGKSYDNADFQNLLRKSWRNAIPSYLVGVEFNAPLDTV